MSKCHMITINCPECGESSQFRVWDSVNTQLDPEMKEKTRSGELFFWTCPACGEKRMVDYPMLYHQMEDQVMIWFAPNDPEGAASQFRKSGEDGQGLSMPRSYRYRVVTSRYQLREKLMLLDEGLDDRVVELMKPFAILALREEDANLRIEAIFFDKTPEGKPVFVMRLEGGQWAQVPFERELYDHVAEKRADMLKRDDEPMIDFSWAWSLTDDRQAEAQEEAWV